MRDLTTEELVGLRREAPLCSLFTSNFENTYGVERHECQDWFDGYADYLRELMKEDGRSDAEYFDLLDEYDNSYTLLEWADIMQGAYVDGE